MRRFFAIAALVALTVTGVLATQVTINIPNAFVQHANQVCGIIQEAENIASDSWSLQICAEEIFRVGARVKLKESLKKVKHREARESILSSMTNFDEAFPFDESVAGRTDVPRVMICGDGIVDVDSSLGYTEQCDPPAEDTCDEDCMNIP